MRWIFNIFYQYRVNLHWQSRFFSFNLLLCHNLNVVIPPTVLNFYSKFMIILWGPWRSFSDGTLVPFTTISIYGWKSFIMYLEGPSNLKVSRLTVKCSQDGNSPSCLQSWTVCSALLLPCCMTQSLHPFISLCLSFLICNIGLIIYVTYLLYRNTDGKPLKALQKLGWYDSYQMYNAICKSIMLKIPGFKLTKRCL